MFIILALAASIEEIPHFKNPHPGPMTSLLVIRKERNRCTVPSRHGSVLFLVRYFDTTTCSICWYSMFPINCCDKNRKYMALSYTHTHTHGQIYTFTKNHTCNVTFKYVSFLHQITRPRVHTWVQLQWRSRWCFHVCVALEYRRVLETSAQHSQGNGWRRLEKANQTAMISY